MLLFEKSCEFKSFLDFFSTQYSFQDGLEFILLRVFALKCLLDALIKALISLFFLVSIQIQTLIWKTIFMFNLVTTAPLIKKILILSHLIPFLASLFIKVCDITRTVFWAHVFTGHVADSEICYIDRPDQGPIKSTNSTSWSIFALLDRAISLLSEIRLSPVAVRLNLLFSHSSDLHHQNTKHQKCQATYKMCHSKGALEKTANSVSFCSGSKNSQNWGNNWEDTDYDQPDESKVRIVLKMAHLLTHFWVPVVEGED